MQPEISVKMVEHLITGCIFWGWECLIVRFYLWFGILVKLFLGGGVRFVPSSLCFGCYL